MESSSTNIPSTITPITTITSTGPEAMFPCTFTITTIKQNGDNYLLRDPLFSVFVWAQRKNLHLVDCLPDVEDPSYLDWLANDYCVIIRLLNNMKEKVIYGIMLLKTAKKIWDILKELYGYEKNISRVFKLYGCLFTLQQGEMSISVY